MVHQAIDDFDRKATTSKPMTWLLGSMDDLGHDPARLLHGKDDLGVYTLIDLAGHVHLAPAT